MLTCECYKSENVKFLRRMLTPMKKVKRIALSIIRIVKVKTFILTVKVQMYVAKISYNTSDP